MNIAVCVKQIPDPATPGELDPETKTLEREGKLILDESDSYGVEMALQLADKAGGGEVTLVSMAPNSEVSGLRTALAMGAAKAVLISDDALKGSDSLGTAKVLAKAVERIGDIDLVLTATESTDGYTGTVPEQIAELLDWPALTFAKHIEIADGTVKIERQTEAGFDEVEASLPAVASVTAGVVRAPLPLVQGDHGGEEQARRRGEGRRPRPVRRPGRLDGCAPGDLRRRARRRHARPARRSRTKVTRTRRSWRSSRT